MTEELAGEQLFGQGGAIYDDKRSVSARTVNVDHPSQNSFARAAFSPQHYGSVRFRHPQSRIEYKVHFWRLRLEFHVRHGGSKLFFQAGNSRGKLPPLGDLLNDMFNLSGSKGLGNVILRASPNRLHRGIDGHVLLVQHLQHA